jgi:long-subunit acyl-CoA synthetase (AMP-forming)
MLSYILNDSGAKVLLIEDRYLDRVLQLADCIPLIETIIVINAQDNLPGSRIRLISKNDLFADMKPIENLDPPQLWDLAGILYTGGTTGPSKGVMMPFMPRFQCSMALAKYLSWLWGPLAVASLFGSNSELRISGTIPILINAP